jgi:hypothetical protein
MLKAERSKGGIFFLEKMERRARPSSTALFSEEANGILE